MDSIRVSGYWFLTNKFLTFVSTFLILIEVERPKLNTQIALNSKAKLLTVYKLTCVYLSFTC